VCTIPYVRCPYINTVFIYYIDRLYFNKKIGMCDWLDGVDLEFIHEFTLFLYVVKGAQNNHRNQKNLCFNIEKRK
jgi:hypothetical protein